MESPITTALRTVLTTPSLLKHVKVTYDGTAYSFSCFLVKCVDCPFMTATKCLLTSSGWAVDRVIPSDIVEQFPELTL